MLGPSVPFSKYTGKYTFHLFSYCGASCIYKSMNIYFLIKERAESGVVPSITLQSHRQVELRHNVLPPLVRCILLISGDLWSTVVPLFTIPGLIKGQVMHC